MPITENMILLDEYIIKPIAIVNFFVNICISFNWIQDIVRVYRFLLIKYLYATSLCQLKMGFSADNTLFNELYGVYQTGEV